MQRVHALQLIGGIFLGWLGSWVLYTVASIGTFTVFGDDKPGQIARLVLGVVALFLIPLVAGVTLIRRGRGRLGSGMLLGVAVGSLIGAGVCTSFIYGG